MPNSSNTFLTDQTPLQAADAVCALLLHDDGRYLVQHRDDMKGIWYPDHWGLFGGGVESGEDPETALHRELQEELQIAPRSQEQVSRFDFDLSYFGLGRFYRITYLVPINDADVSRIVLGEGQAYGLYEGGELLQKHPVVPYDSFALWLHYSKRRLGRGSFSPSAGGVVQ